MLCLLGLAYPAFADRLARIVSVVGEARVGDDPAVAGAAIDADQPFQTLHAAGLRVYLDDGSLLDFGPDSAARLQSPSGENPTLLQLDTGKVRALIRKSSGNGRAKFRVRTKSSLVSVRGTEFVVETVASGEKSTDTVTVMSGVVDAGEIDRMPERLNSGDQWSIGPGKRGLQTRSSRFSAEQVRQIADGLVVHDTTFQQMTDSDGKVIPKEVQLVNAGFALRDLPPPAPTLLLHPILIAEPISPLDRADSSFSQQVLSGALVPVTP